MGTIHAYGNASDWLAPGKAMDAEMEAADFEPISNNTCARSSSARLYSG